MKKTEGGVTAPEGFKAAGLYAGIKKGGKKDMAMIFSEAPCRAAGDFLRRCLLQRSPSERYNKM